jgi:hypothetical protein
MRRAEYHYSASSSPYQISIGHIDRSPREKCGEAAASPHRTEWPRGPRLAGLAETEYCLFGQMVAWSYGYLDDRSGSEKLAG